LIETVFFDRYFDSTNKSNFMQTLSHTFGTFNETTVSPNRVSLHHLVDRLMDSFLPLAVAKHSFFINDIDAAFTIQADEQELAFVVGNMMMNAINHSRSACVRIDVVKKYNGIQLRIRNNGACYYGTVFNSFANVAA
jgi:signal transduction histidine kinase